MKFTRTHECQLRGFIDIAHKNGTYPCLPVSEWTTGAYSHTTYRALPPFVERIERGGQAPESYAARKAVVKFFRDYPRRKFVLVLDEVELGEFLFGSAHGKEF